MWYIHIINNGVWAFLVYLKKKKRLKFKYSRNKKSLKNVMNNYNNKSEKCRQNRQQPRKLQITIITSRKLENLDKSITRK